jgi:hypothetical protein
VYLPSGDGGTKTGLDDFLAAGHTRDDVLERASDELRAAVSGEPKHVTPAKLDAPLCSTAELIADVARLLDRFVVLPSRAAALTIALYSLHTHAFDGAHSTPYLVFQSAVKRSGKTRLEEVVEQVVRDPWRITATSESALFRKIHSARPTLLLDEVDALFGSRTEGTEPVRAILNAGNRPGAAVARVVGEGSEMSVVDFSVYCPKVLAGINTTRWPDTIVDRSIVIQLRRKKASEKTERLRYRTLHAETDSLRGRLQRWASEHEAELREANPELPDGLDDRAAEAWEPLFAIADLADRETREGFGARVRKAALKLAAERAVDEDAAGIVLLSALLAIFENAEHVSTADITAKLNTDETLPFGGYRKGAGIDGRGLARLLKPFGVRPRNIWIKTTAVKGYKSEDLTDSWDRYCAPKQAQPTDNPPVLGLDPLEPLEPNNGGGFRGLDDPLEDLALADPEKAQNPREHWDLADLADTNAETRGLDSNDARSEPCERHPGRGWRLTTGAPWICGICHPPAASLDVEWVARRDPRTNGAGSDAERDRVGAALAKDEL